jgi:hypothetical protein
MPHRRHSVPAEDEPLNIGEIQRDLGVCVRVRFASKQPAEKSPARFFRWRMSVVGLGHGVGPIPQSLATGIEAYYPATVDGDLLSAIKA